jgi:hypothetical protein
MCDPTNTGQVWCYYNCSCKTPARPCMTYVKDIDVCITTGKRVGDKKPDQGIFYSCPFHRSEAEGL